MKKTLHVLACLALVLGAWACEQPKSPDFKLKQELETPLFVEKTYQFLGNSDAIIDTTDEDFVDLFTQDTDGLVRITKEEDFDFGDLDDAIPAVDADPTTVTAQVGEIGLSNFNSGSGNVGSAGFQSITGFSSPGAGSPVPGGSTPRTVNISFTTDYFQSAVIKEDGSLQLTLTNELGFDIDQLSITLNSGSDAVGSATISPFNFDPNGDNIETATLTIPANIAATTPLENINVDVSASWSNTTMESDGGNLIVNDVAGQDLIASQVTAAIESQSFNQAGTSTIDQTDFEFRTSDHFVQLGSGELTINIDNNINIGVESLDITFPDIVDPSDAPLVMNLSNIPSRDDGGTFSTSFDLSDYKIKAEGGTIDYTVAATTENTQQGQGSPIITVSETDKLDAEVDLNNLQISRAEGYVVPKLVLLNNDQTADGIDNLDVFNNNEAELTDIDGMSELSDKLSGLTFENPILQTLYNTNLGVNATVYAVIAGTDANGNTLYLKGKDGSGLDVQSSNEIPDELRVNGMKATTDQVIKFAVDTAETPSAQQGELGENVFDADNANTSEFFSNLPTKVRFIGVAEVNKEQRSGVVVNPVIFDPTLTLDLPLNFSADQATFKDTLDADLADLPDNEDDQELTGATLTVNYTNGLPLDLSVKITMLGENGQPVISKENITMAAAGVDGNGYVSQPNQNSTELTFDESELQDINLTRTMEVDVEINTPQKQAVRIRQNDSVTVQMQLKADITSTVN